MRQDVELWVKELIAAGWKKEVANVWLSPAGYRFRGPYGAWCKMHEFPELSVTPELRKEDNYE